LQNPALTAGQRLAANLQHARAAGQPLAPLLAAAGQPLQLLDGQAVHNQQSAHAQQTVESTAHAQQAAGQTAHAQQAVDSTAHAQQAAEQAAHYQQVANQAAPSHTAGTELWPRYRERPRYASSSSGHLAQPAAEATGLGSILRNVIGRYEFYM
jgi:hypothetical protein